MSEPCKGRDQISAYNPCPQSWDTTWSDISGLPGRQLTKTRGTFISARQNCSRWDLWVCRFVGLKYSWIHDWLRRQQARALVISCARGLSQWWPATNFAQILTGCYTAQVDERSPGGQVRNNHSWKLKELNRNLSCSALQRRQRLWLESKRVRYLLTTTRFSDACYT